MHIVIIFIHSFCIELVFVLYFHLNFINNSSHIRTLQTGPPLLSHYSLPHCAFLECERNSPFQRTSLLNEPVFRNKKTFQFLLSGTQLDKPALFIQAIYVYCQSFLVFLSDSLLPNLNLTLSLTQQKGQKTKQNKTTQVYKEQLEQHNIGTKESIISIGIDNHICMRKLVSG